jgi:two-component system, NtrC family, response regulator AtoC
MNKNDQERVKQLYTQANAAWQQDDIYGVNELLTKMSELNDKLLWPAGKAMELLISAKLESYATRIEQALTLLFEAYNIVNQKNQPLLAAEIIKNISMNYYILSDHINSLKYIKQAFELAPEDPAILNNLGVAYTEKKNYKTALKYYKQASKLFEKQGKHEREAVIKTNVASILIKQKKYNEAESEYLTALKIFSKIKDQKNACVALNGVGYLYLVKKNYPKAETYLKKALKAAQDCSNNDVHARALANLSLLNKQIENLESALNYSTQYGEALISFFKEDTTSRLNRLQKKFEMELQTQMTKTRKLQQNKEMIETQLEHFKQAYANVMGIGQIGVFSEMFRQIIRQADFFHSDRNVPVLIEGETGTGKEIIARIIHYGKKNIITPFVPVNCSAISPTLFESELFGYEEGAFTGARKKGMVGKFELAQGGTLFLDEIGDLPKELQPKLLRALQQKEIFRLGGQEPIKLNVRIICATNHNLQEAMKLREFRPDLYYRLNTGRIFIPPLRERKDEIAPLAMMFLMKFTKTKNKDFRYIDDESMKLIEDFSWPGNVRELQNAMERVVLLNNDSCVRAQHLNFLFNTVDIDREEINQIIIDLPENGISYEQLKRELLNRVLSKFGGNKSKAAEYLKIARTTLYRKGFK